MAISLEKRAEKVGIVLEKRNLRTIPPVRVGFMLDVSGSARHMYLDGTIQEALDRVMGIAVKFDDNQEMDVWVFSNSTGKAGSATPANFENFVKKEILNKSGLPLWGGTAYAPAVEAVRDFYFGGSSSGGGFMGKLFGKKDSGPKDNSPALCLFLTDGANSDRAKTEAMLREAAKSPLYFMMIGVGDPSEFGFIEQMADALPNVGFINLSSLSISDESLYDQLLNEELCGWIAKR